MSIPITNVLSLFLFLFFIKFSFSKESNLPSCPLSSQVGALRVAGALPSGLSPPNYERVALSLTAKSPLWLCCHYILHLTYLLSAVYWLQTQQSFTGLLIQVVLFLAPITTCQSCFRNTCVICRQQTTGKEGPLKKIWHICGSSHEIWEAWACLFWYSKSSLSGNGGVTSLHYGCRVFVAAVEVRFCPFECSLGELHLHGYKKPSIN